MMSYPRSASDRVFFNQRRRMLRGLRKASTNWLGKVVMASVVGFLVISFAIWGIGDIFRGFGRSTVAKIGRTSVSFDQVVFSEGKCVASARAVNVLVDQATRKPVPLTDGIRANFQRWLRRGCDGQ